MRKKEMVKEMEGLAKIAFAQSDWYQKDDEYRHLSDQAAAFSQRHRALKGELSLKEEREKKMGSQVGGALGSLGGGLAGKKFGHPIAGGLAGAIGGAMGGSKLADMTFENRHPKLVETETKAEIQKDFSRHRLFRHMDDKGYEHK
jgi:uncharacterized protein YcfJ